jgi:agmatine deiminase
MPSGELAKKTPLEAGFSMPAEWAGHARCWMAWPCREELWGEALPDTQVAYARVARAIVSCEPVTMIAPPGSIADARRLCGPAIEILPLDIDDSWTRDSGPLFLKARDGSYGATAWHFNAWGKKFEPYEQDARLAQRLCAHLGYPCYQSSLYLEGGAVHVDGEGTILTTESCVLHSNRNPGLSKREAERELCHALGGSKVIWLPGDLAEGDVTDGHVDGLACFARPGLVLMETAFDPSDPRYEILQENRRALEGATDARGRAIEIIPIEEAWEAEREGDAYCISYINFYLANGAVVMPTYGVPGDARAKSVVERAFPDREVIQVDVRKIAIGGGGIHCITQQQPV